MKKGISGVLTARCAALLIILILSTASAFAEKQSSKAGDSQGRFVLAISEGGSGNLTATDIVFRYEEFKHVVEKAVGVPVLVVAVRDLKTLRRSAETATYSLIMSRPADILAEAVRDYGYQAVVMSKEPAHALFIVTKNSPLKALTDIKGKTIVTPDRYAYMWRIANAMMRDNKISMANEQVRSMSDQAAIGWSMEGGFYDVGIVASFSGVGRTWEKNGGRVIARSPEVPNTPMIASPKVSEGQIQRLRVALVSLGSTEKGAAILKDIGVAGFKEASSKTLVELAQWLGNLEAAKE